MHPYQVAPSRPISSTNGASPTVADFPPILTPATPSAINKPLAPMPGIVNTPSISVNKTWVLPPKPKPGRKPAVDTPPTKRKAQNREAQRAFRERRAAKVGELEEEMKKMEEEDSREQEALRERIRGLESNVEDYGKTLEVWRERFNEMQMAWSREKQLRQQAEKEIGELQATLRGGTEAMALPSRRDTRRHDDSEKAQGVAELRRAVGDNEDEQQVSMTCGNCSEDTRCQCIEEAFEMGNIVDDAAVSAFKRPLSPQSVSDNKRICRDPDIGDGNETDFTPRFARPRPPALPNSTSTASSSKLETAEPEPCGFCSDGTPCICAEISKVRPCHDQEPRALPAASSRSMQQLTNGSTASDPCVNGPGTCSQCLSNPTSTLLCKSVAANRSIIADGTQTTNSTSTPSSTGPVLTCADAFTTLSRHPAFPAATDELSSWIPQLTPIPKASSVLERTAFDIEAASVMAVLKMFDRRVGGQGEQAGKSGS